MGHQDAIVRTESVTESMKNNGIQIEKLSCQIANWNRAQAQNRMTQLISQYKNSIELVIANNDAMALGALQAIQSAGRTVGTDIFLVGVDALSEALEDVVAGTMTGTVFNDHFSQSHGAADAAINFINGETNEYYIGCDYVKVTKDNAQEILDMVK